MARGMGEMCGVLEFVAEDGLMDDMNPQIAPVSPYFSPYVVRGYTTKAPPSLKSNSTSNGCGDLSVFLPICLCSSRISLCNLQLVVFKYILYSSISSSPSKSRPSTYHPLFPSGY